mmetsp:Transcript_35269/g.79580  ORF Transcript_35269/g.79580 Transcript_35269/m.79580 type:complete len:227 (+) Transcript_35269:1927-2607(+)
MLLRHVPIHVGVLSFMALILGLGTPQPIMLGDLGSTRSLHFSLREKLLQEVHERGLCHRVNVEVLVAHLILALKRHLPKAHAIASHAQGPQIHLLSVVLVPHLGRPINFGATLPSKAVSHLALTCEAEVRQSHSHINAGVLDASVTDNKVLWFHIPVYHQFAVQVTNAFHHLPCDVAHLSAGDANFFLRMLFNDLHEVAAAEEIHNNASETSLFDDSVNLEDVGMI